MSAASALCISPPLPHPPFECRNATIKIERDFLGLTQDSMQGRIYYYNTQTGQNTWTRPQLSPETSQATQQVAAATAAITVAATAAAVSPSTPAGDRAPVGEAHARDIPGLSAIGEDMYF
jgi:hypothetical protein